MAAAYTPEELARLAHALIRELQDIQGDRKPAGPQPSPLQRRVLLGTIRALMEEEPGPPGGERAHRLWLEQMTAAGWRPGPVKDEVLRTHPNMVGWDVLPHRERDKDYATADLVSRFGR